MTIKRVNVQFDPERPTCPGCGAVLTPEMKTGVQMVDQPGLPQGLMVAYQCTCGSPIGVFIVTGEPKKGRMQ